MADKKQNKEVYYVNIAEPEDTRREILSNAKSMIIVLKKIEKLKTIRKEKIELQNNLRNIMKEIETLFSKLKSVLPEHEAKYLPDKKKEQKQEQPEEKKPSTKKKKKTTEIDRLEKELKDIENKLGNID